MSKHEIQSGFDNEHADAGQDGQTCRARRNSQARTGTGKKYVPCCSAIITTSSIGKQG